MKDVSAIQLLEGLMDLINEADGPVLPTVANQSDEIEGSEDEATMRVNYGGADLFDITIKRV